LISAKFSDFLLFKQCYYLIQKKEHLTLAGLEKIISLRYNLNKGLGLTKSGENFALIKAFPNISPVERPTHNPTNIPNPFWISGFVSGDSTFSVSIEKSNNSLGTRVRLLFGTCLHFRDMPLLLVMSNYFNQLKTNNLQNGNITLAEERTYLYSDKERNTCLYQIKNFSTIYNVIIPFFNKYPILGVKSSDFEDFKKVAELVDKKEHLSEEGMQKIKTIVSTMNLDRK
jgi:hypothetical protein